MPISSFFGKLFGSVARLSDLESIVLHSVRVQLNGDIAMLWDKQVQAINKIQRLPEGTEVNFYRMKKGRPSFDAELAFPNKMEELLLAKVQIGLPNTTNKLTANVWCVKGFLFSIEYEGSVNYFEEASGMVSKPEITVKSELAADLSAR